MPQLLAEWSDPVWEQADTLEIQHFRLKAAITTPNVSARLLYDALATACSASRTATAALPANAIPDPV